MKITIKHRDSEILFDESDNPSTEKASLKWHNATIMLLIEKMVNEIKRLNEINN